jgi:hypothetical protein
VIDICNLPRLPVLPSVLVRLFMLYRIRAIDLRNSNESGGLNVLGFEWTVNHETGLVEYVAWHHLFHSNGQRWCVV